MPHLQIQFYAPQTLEALAEAFLKEFHKPPNSLPVEIDVIIERDLKIEIIPFINLEQEYGLHGYLALSLKKIYMDQYIMDSDSFERRYRFTLAEEIAHLILHKNLFTGIRSPEDYLEAFDKIKESERLRMDLDAKHLAEAILMPAELFRKETLRLSTNGTFKDKFALKVSLISKLADKFCVSLDAASYRFRHLGLDSQIEL